MNQHPEQRTRRIAARIAAVAIATLTPLAGAGIAFADPTPAAPISDNDYGWDNNGHYGYRDHHRQDYNGFNDHLNSNRPYHRNSPGSDRNRGDYDSHANWDNTHTPRGGATAPAVPNPYIPPQPASPLPTPQVQLPSMPHLPLPLTGLPPLPGTGSAG